jgi:hypothetical protein
MIWHIFCYFLIAVSLETSRFQRFVVQKSKKGPVMQIKSPKPLPVDLHMPCYACETTPATHVCRFYIGELFVQVCLCQACMKIDADRLIKSTIGLQTLEGEFPADFHFEKFTTDL